MEGKAEVMTEEGRIGAVRTLRQLFTVQYITVGGIFHNEQIGCCLAAKCSSPHEHALPLILFNSEGPPITAEVITPHTRMVPT